MTIPDIDNADDYVPLPQRRSPKDFLGTVAAWSAGIVFFYIQFGGIYMAFSRHGIGEGVVALLVPPFAWYRAISPLWDKPYWLQEADDKIEGLAYVILNARTTDASTQVEMADRIPKLRRVYELQSAEYLQALDESLIALIDLHDAILRDVSKGIEDDGKFSLDKRSIIESNRELYETATRYPAFQNIIDSTILDTDSIIAMLGIEDLSKVSKKKRRELAKLIDTSMIRWKEGALRTKDRILHGK